jgi:hypothetical protein
MGEMSEEGFSFLVTVNPKQGGLTHEPTTVRQRHSQEGYVRALQCLPGRGDPGVVEGIHLRALPGLRTRDAHVVLDPFEWEEDGVRSRALVYALLYDRAYNASQMHGWVEAVGRIVHPGS